MNRILLFSLSLLSLLPLRAQEPTSNLATQQQAALDIINRFTGGKMNVRVELNLQKNQKGCDRYIYSATSDELTVQASSAVAACRGFYDYVKSKQAGYCGWSGSRFVVPADISCDTVSLITQFRDHQYLNVVTYGYSLPYWDEARWDQELDWMALHGIDMPLMLVGAEQIYREVFYEMGLTKAEVDAWEVGPAHLPWFRMGNLAGNSFDGPLGEEWNTRQRALAHHLLQRMRALGMKPVCPAFGGFVPKAFTRHHSGTTETTGWNWIPADCPNYRLNPASAAFVEVGRRFIQKWEEEYGVGKYYLSDSFNEMEIPSSTATLTQYGDSIFKSITQGSANPEAVWVTQGWTFVYQSGSWGNTKFKALTKNIPDERFMVLYMSPEYGPDKCWETYSGFNGKEWCYTMLPNMGGKTFWTGNLTNYARTYLRNLYSSSTRGNYTGFGMTPEGIENNELLYELICDAGWTKPFGTIDLAKWMEEYARCRFGCYTDPHKELYKVLRSTVYSKYIDHPRFGWQMGGTITGNGNATLSPSFYAGVDSLFAQLPTLQEVNTPLLEYELVELASLYVSGYIEKISSKILTLTYNREAAAQLITSLDQLMTDMDAALDLHPLYRLQRWEDFAQGMAESETTKQRNARNARRIVTVWYGNHTYDEPVQDYAARIWSGLVRDFYRPRLINTLKKRLGLITSFDHIAFENQFVAVAPTLSAPKEIQGDHLVFLSQLIRQAQEIYETKVEPDEPIADPQFPISFDPSSEPSRTDRTLTYVSLQPRGGQQQQRTPRNGRPYQDLTESPLAVAPGATLTPVIGYNGNWMHGYFYLDLDSDGSLSYNATKQSQDGTELLSYTFWSGNEGSEDTGYNSAGKKLTGSSRNTVSGSKITLPTFTAPETPGIYIGRFKVDWNSVNPAGRVGASGNAMDSDNGILANGGFIVDVALAVNTPDGVSAPTAEPAPFSTSLSAYDLSGRPAVLPAAPSRSDPQVYIVNGQKVIR